MKTSYSKPEIIELSASDFKTEKKEIHISKSNKLLDNWPVIFLLIPIYVVYTFLYVPYRFEKELQKTGIEAAGTSLKAEQTGNTFNDQPQIKLLFEIKNAKGGKWNAEVKQYIPLLDLYKIVPGNHFKLKYDPNDKTKVIILSE